MIDADIEAGVDMVLKDGCGGLPFTYKARDIPKRYKLSLELMTPDRLAYIAVGE